MFYQLGDVMPLHLRCTTTAGVPVEPDDAPVAVIADENGIVETVKLPVVDRSDVTGVFNASVNLDGEYSEGHLSIQYVYFVSSVARSVLVEAEIRVGGNSRGAGIAMEYFRQPSANYILYQTDQGFLRRHQNPKVTR